MEEKWMYIVILDLIILSYSSPARLSNIHSPDDDGGGNKASTPWDQGHWSPHSWNGHESPFQGRTTQRAIPKATAATDAQGGDILKSPVPTRPQPITNLEVRLGETPPNDNATSPNIEASSIQENIPLAKDEVKQTPQSSVFTTGPKDESSKSEDLDMSIRNGTIESVTATDVTGALFTGGLENGTFGTEPDGTISLFTSDFEVPASDDEKWSLWHVVIYKKETESYEHICGGSLLKTNMVISAAHCFLSPESQLLETDQFAAAAGKLHSRWDDPRDVDAQYADIKNITITPMRRSCQQPDLAFLILATPFIFSKAVKPVCINFDEDLEKLQLTKGNFGTLASWTVVEDSGCRPSQRLHWLSLPYVEVGVCTGNQIIHTTQSGRICAGEINNTTQCETDSGNGLVFYQNEIPYLRGVASINPKNRLCFQYNTRSFTNIGAATVRANGQIRDIFDKDLSDLGCEEIYQSSSGNLDQTDNASQDQTPIQTESDQEEIEEDGRAMFSAANIRSLLVPKLRDTSAPAYQWHVGVYSKAWTPYMQLCGGSLVKRDVVISAAHCFWDDAAGQKQPAVQFAVAGGKLYRPWNDSQDTYAQHSNVSEIILPVRFRGSATNFQDDIAILRLRTPFTYAPGVQSVCVDFDMQFDKEQLQAGNLGTVAGWGLTKENGDPSQRLNYLELPYIDVADCFASSDSSFLKYITSDKICAGDPISGKALCRGDSGGGLIIFYDKTPYLRGVASTAAANNNLCNAFAIATFTQIYSHRTFLKDNIPGIDKECADLPGKYSDRLKDESRTANIEDAKGMGSITDGRAGNTGGRGSFTIPGEFFNMPYHLVCNCNCNP